MNLELFETTPLPSKESLGRDAYLLRGRALPEGESILSALQEIQTQSPFRNMSTRRGFTMSVAMTNCGRLGWVSDAKGYRYTEIDPLTGKPWPAMPAAFARLAREVADEVGLGPFEPDACLINRYTPGARMSLHQDRNEKHLAPPIVSVSLGLPAVFLFGGFERTDKAQRVPLHHGDIVVWGGEDRMRFHGIAPLKPGEHSQIGSERINLTFRKAG